MPASKIVQRFGERIRELRKQNNLTQEELAEKAKLHHTYIGSVERGDKNISLKNIEKVIRGLNVSLADFFSTFR